MSFSHAMEALREAERLRRAMGPVSDLVPGGLSVEEAQDLCEGNIEIRQREGERIVGYKVGFTNLAVREKLGLPDATYGYLMDSMLLQNGATIPTERLIAPKIECELCFRMGKDLLSPAPSIEEVIEAIDGVHAAFEICDARIKDWKCPFSDIWADNAFSGRVVLGDTRLLPTDLDLLEEHVILFENRTPIAEGKGALAMGHPANAVSWLANRLAVRGKHLTAGQIVMTGTLTPIHPVTKGAVYTARFSRLGELSAVFA